ncbi:MAG: two-component regulator propeller domain-containing protein, partial [Bacteroidales bacterium]
MNGFNFHDIHALHVDTNANLWFSMYNSVYRFNPGSRQIPTKVFEASPTNSIITLFEDPFSNIWAGTFGEGIYIIDKQTSRMRHITHSDGLPDENIISLTGDSAHICIATLGGVAACRLPGNPLDQPLTLNQVDIGQGSGLDINYLYDIYKDSRGELWFATDGSGIISYHNGNTQTYLGDEEPGRQVMLTITEDRSGNLWFASATNGIYRFDGSGFMRYGTEEGLRDLAITTIILDREDNLLMLNKSGIDILDIENGHFSYLDPQFGDQQNEFFLNAVGQDPQGNIWMGSEKGIVKFACLPDAFFSGPKTVIDRVKIIYEDFDFRNQTLLEYQQNYLIFHFSAIWYQHLEAVSFQYQLEPHDPGWFTTSSREVSYSGLAPGHYTFKVRSAV